MPISIQDIYKYAQLATAGYVDLSGATDFNWSLRCANEPLIKGVCQPAFGTNFFPTTGGWQVVGDPRFSPPATHTDPASGFAATLFQRGTEKVLSIRGAALGSGLANCIKLPVESAGERWSLGRDDRGGRGHD